MKVLCKQNIYWHESFKGLSARKIFQSIGQLGKKVFQSGKMYDHYVKITDNDEILVYAIDEDGNEHCLANVEYAETEIRDYFRCFDFLE